MTTNWISTPIHHQCSRCDECIRRAITIATATGSIAGSASEANCGASVRREEACRWYALCDNAADGYVEHPILGDVPTCERCASRHELILMPNKENER